MRKKLFLLPVAVLCLSAVHAENWPQWRGPAMNGVSQETGLPSQWGTEDNVAWKIPLPAWSGSTPIIWGDRIFLNVAENGSLWLWSLSKKDGAVLWKKELGGGDNKQRKQNMSSPSPVTDGTGVYVMTGTGVFKGFDFAGNELWVREIQKDYGSFGLNWGYASSPLLFEDALYVQVLHGMKTDDPSYVLRIDKKTGKTVWRIDRPTEAIRESPDAYTTPALLRRDNKVEIVITGGDCVTGHDPKTGQELWRANGLNPDNNPSFRIVASAVVQDGVVYAPSREKPLLALRPGGQKDVAAPQVLWTFRNGPDVPSPVTDGKYFYSVNDRGIVWCLNAATGEEIYAGQRLKPGTYSASPVLADGKIYITSEEGLTSVIKAGPEFQVIAENNLNGYSLSSPAISAGQLFLRTDQFLYCIGKRDAK